MTSVTSKIKKAAKLATSVPISGWRFFRHAFHQQNDLNLYYVVPGANWVTDWMGHYITTNIHHQFGWQAHTTSTPQLLVDHILHYGEVGAFLHSLGAKRNQRNTVIASIFHGDINPQYPLLSKNTQKFLDNNSILKRILVSCQIMKKRLAAWGVEPEKVMLIPLGVDTTHFKPPTQERRLNLRKKYGIPPDAVCIGSFQKDGVGWDDGLTPKLIKGPDVLLDVIEKLHGEHKLFILLSGPARGFVKNGLDRLGVPYCHTVLQNYPDIVDLYACLDLYLMTSREEGGPKAVLESIASCVPIVSTRAGLAPDIIQHEKNGLLAGVDDVDTLTELSAKIISNEVLRNSLVVNGRKCILNYDWKIIAARYYHELYQPILETLD